MSAQARLAAFAGCGIELEYMIVDSGSLDVRPIADRLLENRNEVVRGAMGWSNELALHLVEIKNLAPEHCLEGLAEAFQGEIEAVNARLAAFEAQLMPGAMHPWMDPRRETWTWPHEGAPIYDTYQRIFDCHRHGWSNIQSMHLNLPFATEEEFARLHAAVRLALPLLPALAASSPYAEGRATGFMDTRLEHYRHHQRALASTMGEVIPEPVSSRAEYELRILAPMYREIARHDPEHLLQHEWLNARGAIPRFERSAIEIRVLDVQECVPSDLAVAAAVTALVRRLFDAGAGDEPFPTERLVRIFHACIRDAEDALVDDEAYLERLGLVRCRWRAGDLWGCLIDDLCAAGLLAHAWEAPLRFILRHGTLSRRLFARLGAEPSRAALADVWRELCECLREGRMYPG